MGSMSHLIAHSLKEDREQKPITDENDKTNLINPTLGQIFPNVSNMLISAIEFPFSLIGFLDVIRETKWKQVIIRSDKWIDKVWEKEASVIEKAFMAAGYGVSHSHQRNLF